MPIDSHSYLVSQGWEGKGSGLRKGAIARPLAIPQKRNLSGVGKDRDEAFPFWDHLFTAASKTIQIKTYDSDDASEDELGDETSNSTPQPAAQLHRTMTGILSNRRPTSGTPVSTSGSGSSTPMPNTITQSGETSTTPTPQVSLLTLAKREAAKCGLYSKFFRGPVLGPDDGFESLTTTTPPPTISTPSISTTIIPVVDASGISSGNTTSADPESLEKPSKERKRISKDERHPPPRSENEPTVMSVEYIVSTYLPNHRLTGKDQRDQEKPDKDMDKAARREKKKRKEKGLEKMAKAKRKEDGSEFADEPIDSVKVDHAEGDGRKRMKKKRQCKEQES